MPALIAVVRKSERRVHLDPAFGKGDGVICKAGDEVRLLRTSEFGHLGEHAKVVASMLRRAGWRVDVRDCSNLQPRPTRIVGGTRPVIAGTPDQVKVVAMIAGNELLERIGEVRQEQVDPMKSYRPPEPLPPPADPIRLRFREAPPKGCRYRCRTCGHVCRSNHVLGHIKNKRHNDWEPVTVRSGEVMPAPAQACSPEASGSASSASDQRPNGYTHPATESES